MCSSDLSERRVARGEYPLWVPQISVNVQGLKGLPIRVIVPKEGVAYVRLDHGMLKNAPHPNAARVWMNYLVSKRGSSEMSKSASYGTHPDATPPSIPGFKFPAPSEVWAIAPDRWETIRESWVEEWKKTVLKN